MRELVGELRVVVPSFVEGFEDLYGYSEVEAVETDAGLVPVIAVGSDGGGGYFLVRRDQSGPILHVGAGALKGGLLSPFGITATVADSLDEFVGKIVLAVRRATNGANTNPFDSA